jgi:aspartyl protease family protein
MRGVMFLAVMAVAMAILVPKLYQGQAPLQAAPVVVATATTTDNSRSVTISRGRNGHFQTEASVDGRRIDFLVDTGATTIALRESDAARLGIRTTPRDYTMRTATANGIVKVAPAELNRVEIGGVIVRNVMAVVIPDESLGQNLLGMSFLSKLRWEQRNGKLILEQ